MIGADDVVVWFAQQRGPGLVKSGKGKSVKVVKNNLVKLKKAWGDSGRLPKGSIGGVIEPRQFLDANGKPLAETSSERVSVQMCGLRLNVPRYALEVIEGQLYE